MKHLSFYIIISLFGFHVLGLSFAPVIAQTPQYCATKFKGDSDCAADTSAKSITLLDYAIWYGEFINGCSATNLSGCGTNADATDTAMDANFNYAGTNYILTDSKVDTFDYAVWIQGYLAQQQTGTTPTVIPTGSTPIPTTTTTVTPPLSNGGSFPGAEGYGSQSKGGRGGKVMYVTNLNDSGAGSLRDCMESSGARTCVFKVGGTITLNGRINVTNPYLTVAGQSAPGGIQIKMSGTSGDAIQITTHNVILRYLTIRPGTLGVNSRALSISAGSGATRPNSAHDVIVDHLSTSWSEDEQLIAWYDTYNVTIQNSLIAEGLTSGVQKGPNLGGGGNGGIGGPYTFYGNAVALFYQRMPRVRVSKAGEDIVDIVNNLIYNPTWNGNYNGAYLSDGGRVNLIGNYVKVPSGTVDYYMYIESGQVYAKSNITPKRPTDSGSESAGVVSGSVASTPFTPASGAKAVSSPKTPQNAYDTALTSVGNSAGLDCTGNWVARRDTLDTRIINDIRNGTGSLKTSAGPWPTYTGGTACPDSDNDGMSDTWETAKGLAVGTADNNADPDNDTYTNLEEYLNGTSPK